MHPSARLSQSLRAEGRRNRLHRRIGMGVVVGIHGSRCVTVHRDHDVMVWIDKDKLAKDAFRHVRASVVQPPFVTVALIAF